MAMKAKIQGREALTRKLNQMAPNANKYAAEEKLAIAKEAAARMASSAPAKSGDYRKSIQGDFQRNRSDHNMIGGGEYQATKDPDATGIFASYIWRFLEHGTKFSPGEGPKQDRRYKRRVVSTKVKKGHAATRPFPHIYANWRAMRDDSKRRIHLAIIRGVREAMGKN